MNKKVSLGNFSKADLLSKLPKSITTTHVVLMVVSLILLALTIYFAISYFGAMSDKKDLDNKITQKQQQISAIGEMQNIGSLESQLDQALQDLITKSPFPEQVSNIEGSHSIIEAEQAAAIKCYQKSYSSSGTITVNSGSYMEKRYSIASQGPTDSTGEKIIRIVNFLEELEEAYDTSSINGLSLSDGDGDGQWTFSFTYSILTLSE